jgi:hypothetical protein
VNSIEGCELLEDGGVTERNVDHAVVSKSAHGSNAGRLLTTTETSGGDEETSVLAPEAAALPLDIGQLPVDHLAIDIAPYLATSLVPEDLELRGEVSVTSWNSEEEGIVLLKDAGVAEDLYDLVRLEECVHRSFLLTVCPVCSVGACILERTSLGRVSSTWKMSQEPPALLIPSASASAIARMCPYMEYCRKPCQHVELMLQSHDVERLYPV